MADNQSQAETSQFKRHVVFLTEDPHLLSSTTWYLEKRGWKAKVFSSYGDLLVYCSNEKPDCIFVSFTGENHDVTKYPASLEAKLNIPVIPYGDAPDILTVRRLRAFKGETIMPPISGHSVYSKLHNETRDRGKITVHSKNQELGADVTYIKSTNDVPLNIQPEQNESSDGLRFEINLEAEKSQVNYISETIVALDESQGNPDKAKREQVFFEGLGRTFQEACQTALEKHIPLREAKKITVLPMSGEPTGLLVLAMADQDEVDSALVESLRDKMGGGNSYVQFNGLLTKTLQIEIDEVDFKLWTSHKSKFVTRANHKGREVMMAFFEMNKSLIEVIPSHDPAMSQIHLSNLTADTRINFDAYLYLHSNRKYLKYIREGSKVSEIQLRNLKKRDIESLHIDNDAQDNYRAYVAKNFLNSTIISGQSNLIKKAS